MTNEEAIMVLEMVECHGSLTQKAKEMAISALSFPKGEKGTNLISREAVIDLLNQFGYYDKEMERDLSAIPSAIPERKKGEWKKTYLDHVAMGERPRILYCSVCCQCIAYPTNYCPNCGADMRGE